MTSSDHINYAIRPNKAVERKLVFEILSVLAKAVDFRAYRYIGLGAPWFVDFVMAHRELMIDEMISIEKDEILATRAEFNKPYGCVTVIHGDSDVVIPDLSLEDRSLIAWLDYDTSLEGPVLQDLSTLCQRAPKGSILLATINAHRSRLPSEDVNGEPYDDFADRLRALAGDLIPPEVPKQATQASGYPPYLVSVLFTHMHRQVRKAGKIGRTILPLLNIGYSDNAPMVTVGAAIVDEKIKTKMRTALEEQSMEEYLDQSRHLKVGVPPLTVKEKAGLDRLVPRDEPPTEKEVEDIGFRLRPSQITAYHRFYRYYPVFGEVAF